MAEFHRGERDWEKDPWNVWDSVIIAFTIELVIVLVLTAHIWVWW